MSLFKNTTQLKAEIETLKGEKNKLQTKLDELEATLKEYKDSHKVEVAELKSDARLLEKELEIKVYEAVKVEREQNIDLKEKNAVLLKQVEILEQAFENMGFDVKDMKDILDKLVDAVVSKNKVNIVK